MCVCVCVAMHLCMHTCAHMHVMYPYALYNVSMYKWDVVGIG